MTDQERTRIKELRASGMSYKAIADETGTSLGSIKMFFKRDKEDETPVPRCEQCHRLLRVDVVRSQRRFCSDACRVKWWSDHPERMEGHRFKCLRCGKLFYSRKPAKYCSRACYYVSRRGGESNE